MVHINHITWVLHKPAVPMPFYAPHAESQSHQRVLHSACRSWAVIETARLASSGVWRCEWNANNALAIDGASVQALKDSVDGALATFNDEVRACAEEARQYARIVTEPPSGVSVKHTAHPFGPRYDGQFFFFDVAEWRSKLGNYATGDIIRVCQYRNGLELWRGAVVVWNNHNGVHGALDKPSNGITGNRPAQWQAGDIIGLAM